MFLIAITFIGGMLGGYFLGFGEVIEITPVIAILLFLVGFSSGNDNELLSKGFSKNVKHYLFPLISLVGSIVGGLVVATLVQSIELQDALLVALGMGYYSVPSILVTTQVGVYAGSLLLVSNILREIIILIAAPLLVKVFGKSAPIAVGGATTMDVSLPLISKYSGKDYVLPSFINGFILTLSVPILISLIISII